MGATHRHHVDQNVEAPEGRHPHNQLPFLNDRLLRESPWQLAQLRGYPKESFQDQFLSEQLGRLNVSFFFNDHPLVG
jgi:hypothetical protein